MSVNYGEKLALEGVNDGHRQQPGDRIHRPVRLRQEHVPAVPEPDERLDLGFRLGGELLYYGHDLYGHDANRVEVRRRIGMVFQKPNPFPKSIYDNIAWAARNLGMKDDMDERVERALRSRRAVGRGQGPAQVERAGPLRRPAAASLHRARDRDRAGRGSAGRARVGARPDRDRVDRGPDPRAEGASTRS